MKNYLVLFLTLTLIACGPSKEEKEKIAAVTCAVMGETRDVDGAIRVEKINEARDKIGGEPFLRGDDAIKEAFEYRVCEELVLNATIYDETLGYLKYAKWERERIAAQKRAERERIAAEQRAERERIAAEQRAERERIAAEQRAERERIAAQKRAERERIVEEKQRIADGKPTVKEEFYPNGELKRRTNYQSKDDGGKKHGLNRTWWDNGQLMSEMTYKNGKEHGLIRLWDENGQLELETCTSNGEYVGMSNCQG
jgi:hypothetical protein